ncbi:hypothetical protein FBUS_09185 [Fasciolopsis buskii]|uniref:CS domain-containing protein n=1 Tax=Fasciolopsis buskii TaxID=27845 RepID=A0A8E0VPV6_9TREM|nr:hypothetical protein FBUS_09184 [Fasciolopsis buski]KAA0197639.1 hypothetical protein FBUS_09185 [Fasciolopsis buski]
MEDDESDQHAVDYAVDEPAKDRVRVRIRVDGIRSRTRVARAGVLPRLVRQPSNANILFEPTPYGFYFECTGNEESDQRRYVLKVNYLPGEIIPEECSYRVCTDMVELILRKKVANFWTDELLRGLPVVK